VGSHLRLTRRRRLAAALLLAATATATSGCKSKNPTGSTSSARPPASAPPDRLAKGEIPEGKERAFTLPLPLQSSIRARFATSIHVGSTHSREELANFTRARVKEGTSSVGASETRFDNVIATKDPSRRLTIEIRTAGVAGDFRSQMVVSDVTPAPEEPNLSDADRWRKAGMTPDGKLLDPKNRQ
jgi:hypothetical protein